jgi:hypothetical protein
MRSRSMTTRFSFFARNIHAGLACLGMFICITGSAQVTKETFTAELNIKFSSGEIKKIERAVEIINEAEALQSKAEKEYADLTPVDIKERISDSYRLALKHLFESSETYKEGYNMVYEVFKDKANSFWQKMLKNNHRAAGMEKAKYYQGTATKTLNRALIRRQQVLQSDRYDYSIAIMKDALNLEKLAVRDEGREMQICADYPVEYNYGWENDLSLEQIVALMKDPNVHEPPTDIFATVDQTATVDSSLFKDIIFKVQIAAHTMPITDEYLNALYKGNLKIDMIFEDDWYKYSIGRYKTFDEADATRIECNIKKAFVVAYQEGKKISTQEAVRLLERSPK